MCIPMYFYSFVRYIFIRKNPVKIIYFIMNYRFYFTGLLFKIMNLNYCLPYINKKFIFNPENERSRAEVL